MAYSNTQPRPGTMRERTGNPKKPGSPMSDPLAAPTPKEALTTHYDSERSGGVARNTGGDPKGLTKRGYGTESAPAPSVTNTSADRVKSIGYED